MQGQDPYEYSEAQLSLQGIGSDAIADALLKLDTDRQSRLLSAWAAYLEDTGGLVDQADVWHRASRHRMRVRGDLIDMEAQTDLRTDRLGTTTTDQLYEEIQGLCTVGEKIKNCATQAEDDVNSQKNLLMEARSLVFDIRDRTTDAVKAVRSAERHAMETRRLSRAIGRQMSQANAAAAAAELQKEVMSPLSPPGRRFS
eukprot:gnl/MRDRNA2_/MRDRNA2_29679_c0_seq1.p1 gnl/MRDRNA2_/MRDRNA2_29679_c0~~gnl/MRDRNA2_/MRDRNA2_29679_c0_seq1.p1  ORF type:complete len:199 (+),score=45.29 gnl/MRDRNA2_/MRDRNA2_29679_c0_seq1:74-670(+)